MILTVLIIVLSGYISRNSYSGIKPADISVITDMAGREVRVPSRVKKVVGLEAGALRILVYLQAVDMIAGVEEIEKNQVTRPYRMAHPELAVFPSVGPIHGGEAELIAAAEPDVIFWTYTTAGKAEDLQRKTGISVVVLDYGDLDRNREVFYQSLRLTAGVIGKEERAEEIIGYINDTIRDLKNRVNGADISKKVYIGGVASRGAHGISSTEPDYAPFVFINANNVASEINLDHVFVDKEQLIKWNPDIIFIDSYGCNLVLEELKKETVLYNTLDAVKSGELYTVLPYNTYTTNYATVLADAYFIGKILYPDGFADIDPEKKAGDIYQFFVGRNVFQQMKKLFGGFEKLIIK